jgi:hypothetical protein
MDWIILLAVVSLAGPFLLVGGIREYRRQRELGESGGGPILQSVVGAALSAVLGVVVLAAVSLWAWLNTPTSKGRLLRIRDRSILPPPRRGDDWRDDAEPDLSRLGAWERAILGQAWLLSARMEHASVPAFAQLSLQLAGLGAPPALVARCHDAALDEIRHASRCFALASAYAGRDFTAGAVPGLRVDETSFPRLAVGSLLDGCLAEGLAADVAARGAGQAADPVIASTLTTIAADEARHAELAWDVLVWCLIEGGADTRAAVAARLVRLDDELTPRLPDVPGISVHRLREHGLVDQGELGELAHARIAATRERLQRVLA